MMHIFCSRELVLPVIKRNTSLAVFICIVGLCSYHFFLVREKLAIYSDGVGLELLSAFVRRKPLERKRSQLSNSAANAAGNQGGCRSPPGNVWVARNKQKSHLSSEIR